jgi:hypothetical protein
MSGIWNFATEKLEITPNYDENTRNHEIPTSSMRHPYGSNAIYVWQLRQAVTYGGEETDRGESNYCGTI